MSETCSWKEDDPWGDTPETWAGTCGVYWYIDGKPEEHEINFCPKCGKPVVFVHWVEKEEEEEDNE